MIILIALYLPYVTLTDLVSLKLFETMLFFLLVTALLSHAHENLIQYTAEVDFTFLK